LKQHNNKSIRNDVTASIEAGNQGAKPEGQEMDHLRTAIVDVAVSQKAAQVSQAKKIHYAWIVFAVTFVALIVAAGVRSVPSILIVPLENEFGWSRATVSSAVSINLLMYGLIGPFAAALMNRFGVRRVMISAFVFIAVGVSATAFMRQPWQLQLLWGFGVGTGAGMVALVMGATVVNRWFHHHRGLLIGILTASTATGQLLFLPLLAKLVEGHGWRTATWCVTVAAIALVPLAIFFVKDDPARLGLRPFGLPDDEVLSAPVQCNPLTDALSGLLLGLRSRDFYMLAGSFFICGATTSGLVGTHLVPACIDHGIPEVQAAGLLAMMGVFDLIGTTASGWLSDRFNNRILLFAYYGLRGLSLLYLPYAFEHGSHGLGWFAVFYGLDWIATVPPTLALTTRSFGRERATILFGWVVAAHQVGAALAAYGAGYLRSTEGHYDHAFLASAALCFVAAVAVLRPTFSAVKREAISQSHSFEKESEGGKN
jgi:predicted MFS family arabinose efflux permease